MKKILVDLYLYCMCEMFIELNSLKLIEGYCLLLLRTIHVPEIAKASAMPCIVVMFSPRIITAKAEAIAGSANAIDVTVELL